MSSPRHRFIALDTLSSLALSSIGNSQWKTIESVWGREQGRHGLGTQCPRRWNYDGESSCDFREFMFEVALPNLTYNDVGCGAPISFAAKKIKNDLGIQDSYSCFYNHQFYYLLDPTACPQFEWIAGFLFLFFIVFIVFLFRVWFTTTTSAPNRWVDSLSLGGWVVAESGEA
jgi:hypothetical protein